MFTSRPILEREALRFVIGNGSFVDDVKLENIAYLGVLRSPIAHGQIENVDLTAAASHRGIVAAITSGDIVSKTRSLKTRLDIEGIKNADHFCLATGGVRYVGEPIAAVAAEDRYLAEDALDLIEVKLSGLPPLVKTENALNTSNLIYPEWGDNIALHRHFSSGGDVAKDFSEADVVVKETIRSHRYTGTPIEPRAYLSDYNDRTKLLTLYTSTQNPHVTRTLLADALNFPENRIRVVIHYLPGPYDIRNYEYDLLSVVTNKTPYGAYRGLGKADSNFVM